MERVTVQEDHRYAAAGQEVAGQRRIGAPQVKVGIAETGVQLDRQAPVHCAPQHVAKQYRVGQPRLAGCLGGTQPIAGRGPHGRRRRPGRVEVQPEPVGHDALHSSGLRRTLPEQVAELVTELCCSAPRRGEFLGYQLKPDHLANRSLRQFPKISKAGRARRGEPGVDQQAGAARRQQQRLGWPRSRQRVPVPDVHVSLGRGGQAEDRAAPAPEREAKLRVELGRTRRGMLVRLGQEGLELGLGHGPEPDRMHMVVDELQILDGLRQAHA